MHGIVGNAAKNASDGKDNSVSGRPITDTSVGSDENWFAEAARELYGELKAGTALYYATDLGGDERSGIRTCDRYVAGGAKPPAYFLRRLLRSHHGRQWLFAVMSGCDEPWWREMRLADAYEQKRKEVEL